MTWVESCVIASLSVSVHRALWESPCDQHSFSAAKSGKWNVWNQSWIETENDFDWDRAGVRGRSYVCVRNNRHPRCFSNIHDQCWSWRILFFLVCEEEEVTCMFAMNAFRKHAALHSAGVKMGNVVQKNFGFLRKLSSLTPCDVVALTCFCFCLSPFFPSLLLRVTPAWKTAGLLFGRRYFRRCVIPRGLTLRVFDGRGGLLCRILREQWRRWEIRQGDCVTPDLCDLWTTSCAVDTVLTVSVLWLEKAAALVTATC